MTLTLEQARAMHWPFLNPRQPIGLLLDQGTLSVHDLQTALRKAYSPRFKAACLIILQDLQPRSSGSLDHSTRSRVTCNAPRPAPLPEGCPICDKAVQADGSGWRCVADRLHYWQYRADRLRSARQRWLNNLAMDERPYLDDAWLTTCDRSIRDQYLLEHALTYPAGS